MTHTLEGLPQPHNIGVYCYKTNFGLFLTFWALGMDFGKIYWNVCIVNRILKSRKTVLAC
jgi:hypothetical protein